MVDRRHVDQKAAGQGNVRRDACTLLPQRLFGDLDDDLLAAAQQIGDLRHHAFGAALGARLSLHFGRGLLRRRRQDLGFGAGCRFGAFGTLTAFTTVAATAPAAGAP